MTMAEFRRKYGHQGSGLRLCVDELISRARFYPQRVDDNLVDAINQALNDLQSALMNNNLKDWYID